MLSFKSFLLLENGISPLLASNQHIRLYQSHGKRMRPEEKEELLQQAYDELLPKFIQIQRQFEQIVKSATPKKGMQFSPIFYSGIKAADKLIEKITKRGKDAAKISDIVRGAIVFDESSQVKDFISSMMRRHGNLIKQHEEKVKGSDPTFGYYGAHHLDLNIGGLNVELQVMTKKVWKAKEGKQPYEGGGNVRQGAHKYYEKYRTDPSKAPKDDRETSKKMYRMANKPRFRKEELEAFVEFVEGLELVSWEDFLSEPAT